MRAAEWSEARDARLRRLRAEGCGWHAIGQDLGVSPDMARERARRIGARRAARGLPDSQPDPQPDPWQHPDLHDPRRPPLPAGHPLAWALLTRGTLLGNDPWPPIRPATELAA